MDEIGRGKQMKVSRLIVACSSALMLLGVAGCSDNSSDTPSDGGQTDPFAFLAGKYGVGISPRFANCTGEVYFPQEAWVVTTFFTTVTVMTIPNASTAPQPVSTTVDVADAGGEAAATGTGSSPSNGASSGGTIPPTFRGEMGSTLQWKASNEEQGTSEGGCLARRSTVLGLQFAPEGTIVGTRSVFNEYAGGADCTASCRMIFEVQGAKLAAE
jgi:hypothetical protein